MVVSNNIDELKFIDHYNNQKRKLSKKSYYDLKYIQKTLGDYENGD